MEQDGDEIKEEIVIEDEEQILLQQDVNIVSKLEEFCCSPDYTDSIQGFMQEHCVNFVETKEGGEHSIENFMLYKKYCSMIEDNLQEFLKKENINVTRLLDACQRVNEMNENFVASLDYILACTEYQDFYNLMVQYKNMYNYEYEDALD